MNYQKIMVFKKTCFYFISVFSLLFLVSLIPRKWVIYAQENNTKLCVNQVGIHTNIIVPAQNEFFDWRQFLNIEIIGRESSKDYKYLGFGWGDRDFYTTNPSSIEESIPLGVQALFFSRGAVMRVKGYQNISQQELECVGVSAMNYLNTVQFIRNYFELNAQGQIIFFSYDNESDANYYVAKGHYSILRNSNNWTAEGLRKANVNTPLWAGIPHAVMFHLSINPE